MLSEVVHLLRCPHCRGDLALTGRTAGCPGGHRFDLARRGHLNLLTRAAGVNADNAAMVAARTDFLSAGHYQPIAELLGDAAIGTVVLEAGAGTGYYLASVRARLGPRALGIATDLSAYACRRSARLPRVGAVVADTWAGLPVRDRVADTVLAVFAPRNFSEFARICAPTGRVLMITPLPDHLAEVRRVRGLLQIETGKHQRLLAAAEPWLDHLGHQELRYRLALPAADVDRLVGMGPTAFHAVRSDRPVRSNTPPRPAAEPDVAESTDATVAVRLDAFAPRMARSATGAGQRE